MESAKRYICIHGHFYQPPRENPWLDEIEIQESASPFHDWNERIAYECYRPNTQARLLSEQGKLHKIINNYRFISFDFGPTLFSWMQKHAAEAYEGILEADAESVKTRSGHGNAIAHAYNHMILPLASTRDKITQIRWGIRDFQRRFNRDPEGMWLPETAVDRESLEIMADEGITFTILAQRQAKRFRNSPSSPWKTIDGEAIDPSRPYNCHFGKNRQIVIFFYDGPISQAIAYESLLNSGAEFVSRLTAAFNPNRTWPQLVNIATDGESYGHHHRFGEMALAFALDKLSAMPDVLITNYGEFLAKYPAQAEAEYVENSAWSCAHGVGRWREDCGCSVSRRRDWNQKWRTPLRQAMDMLRDRADALFVEKTQDLLKDPWAARDAYIDLLVDRSPKIADFVEKHQTKKLRNNQVRLVMRMLDMQKARMFMYTSCGWFFDDIVGLEALQVMRYAARVLQILKPDDPLALPEFLKILREAKSNARPQISGDKLFETKIMPQVAGLEKVVAHIAISSIFEDIPLRERFYRYKIRILDLVKERSAGKTFVVGHMNVTDLVTAEARELTYVVIHHGGVDLRCSVLDFGDIKKYEATKRDLIESFRGYSSTELIRKMDRHFPGVYFSIKDLFMEQRRVILESVTRRLYRDQAVVFEEFYRKNRELAALIKTHEAILPDTFVASARFVINRTLRREIKKLADGYYPDELQGLIQEAQFWGIKPDVSTAGKFIVKCILDLLNKLSGDNNNEITIREIVRFLDLGKDLEIPLDLSEPQIIFFNRVRELESGDGKLLEKFTALAERLSVELSLAN